MTFLEKHPTPWKLVRKPQSCGEQYECVLDANGKEVIKAVDAESYQAWFGGDIDELIDWVNHIGE